VTVQYAKELHDSNILINAACPGFVATDLNGSRGVRTPEQGEAIAIRLAILSDGGSTGGFFDHAGVVPGDRLGEPDWVGGTLLGQSLARPTR